MAKETGVAELELPGQVLTPNAVQTDANLFAAGSDPGQFGIEMNKPNIPNAVQNPPGTPSTPDEQKRFEYWQGQAQKAQEKAKALELQLAEKATMDPLLKVIREDKEAFEFLQARLNGNRAPDKPLEPPQKPENYNKVEAFQNPESESFKWREANETYREQRIQQVAEENRRLREEQKLQLNETQRQLQEREKLAQFKSEVVAKGVPDEEFNEFAQMVFHATQDDMVDYFRYKKSQSANATNIPNFDVGINSTAGGGKKVINAGDIFVQQSRRM